MHMQIIKKAYRFILPCIAFALVPATSNAALEKWPYVEYSYVKSYTYNLVRPIYRRYPYPIINKDLLDPTTVGIGIKLQPRQIKRLTRNR